MSKKFGSEIWCSCSFLVSEYGVGVWLRRVLAVVLMLGAELSTKGADVTLTATDAAGTSSFNTAGGWSDANAPSLGNDYFTSNFTLRTPADSSDYVFQGDSLQINSGGTIALKGLGVVTIHSLRMSGGTLAHFDVTGVNIATVAGNISLLTDSTFSTGTGGRTMVVNADISGPGLLVKTDPGLLVLGGNNSFGAGTMTYGSGTVDRGAIRLVSASALGNVTSVNMPANNSGQSRIELAGGINFQAYNLNTAGRSNARTTGATLINASGNNTWNGIISINSTGGGYAIRSDSGTLTLNGNVQNAIATTRDWQFGGAGDIHVNGTISQTGGALSIIKFGEGKITLGAENSYAGNTTIEGGTLALAGTNRIPTTSALIFSGNSSLELDGNAQTVPTLRINNGVSASMIGSGGTVNATNMDFVGTSSLDIGGNTLNIGTMPLSQGRNATLSGAGGSLVWSGGASAIQIGTTNLSNAATFNAAGLDSLTATTSTVVRFGLLSGVTGGTQNQVVTVNLASSNFLTAASLLLGDNTSNSGGGGTTVRLGESNIINANNILVAASGRSNGLFEFQAGLNDPSVQIRGTNGADPVSVMNIGMVNNFTDNAWSSVVDFSEGTLDGLVNAMNVGVSADRYGTSTGTFRMGAGSLSVNTMVIGRAATAANPDVIYTSAGRGNVELSGGIMSVGTMTIGDRQPLANPDSQTTAHGTFALISGTLEATLLQKGANGSASFLWEQGTIRHRDAATDLTIAAGLIITMQSGNEHIFEAAAGRSVTVDASITGSGPLVKQGDGLLILGGANDYSGATFVQGGSVMVNGAYTGGGTVNVSNGGLLGGVGSVGDVVVAAGGIVSPGLSPGTLSVAGLSLSSGAHLFYELGAPNQGANPGDSDFIAIANDLVLSGSLHISAAAGFGTPSLGDTWVLMSYAPGMLTDQGLLIATQPVGVSFAVDTQSMDGQVLLRVVPEPGTAVLLLLGAAGLIILRRRSGF